MKLSDLLEKKQYIYEKLDKIEKHIQRVLGDDYDVEIELPPSIFNVILVSIKTTEDRVCYKIRDNDKLSNILHTIGGELLLSLLKDNKFDFTKPTNLSDGSIFSKIISKHDDVNKATLEIKKHILGTLNSNEDGDEYKVRVYLDYLSDCLEIEIWDSDGNSFERFIRDDSTLEGILRNDTFRGLLAYLLFEVK